jgi:hypothetical protein
MASSGMSLGDPSATVPPPPSGAPSTPAPPPPTQSASPAPATPSPQVEQGSRLVIQAVQALRKVGQDFPGAMPAISKINDLMREVQMKVMAAGKQSEPAAPPVPST